MSDVLIGVVIAVVLLFSPVLVRDAMKKRRKNSVSVNPSGIRVLLWLLVTWSFIAFLIALALSDPECASSDRDCMFTARDAFEVFCGVPTIGAWAVLYVAFLLRKNQGTRD